MLLAFLRRIVPLKHIFADFKTSEMALVSFQKFLVQRGEICYPTGAKDLYSPT